MTVAEAITTSGITPSASYTGIETADDFVFAIQTESANQTTESAWIVSADHVKEHSGALNTSTNSDTFIRTGSVDTKSAVQRTQTAGRIVSQQPVSCPAQPPAARMVERVDKATRRKALLAELAALDD